MSSFKSLYVMLDKNQIHTIRSSCLSLSPPIITLNAKQVQNVSEEHSEGFIMIPLTSFQIRNIELSRDIKSDCTIQLNLHQLKDLSSVNFNEDIDITNKTILFQSKKRIFKL